MVVVDGWSVSSLLTPNSLPSRPQQLELENNDRKLQFLQRIIPHLCHCLFYYQSTKSNYLISPSCTLVRLKIVQLCLIISYFQPRLSVEWNAFEDSSSQGKEASLSWNRIPVNGTVTIKNTVEAFKVPLVFLFGCSSFAGVLVLLLLLLLLLMSSSLLLTFPRDDPYNASQAADKAAFIQQEGSRLWEDILQDRWRENPDRLVR